MPASAARRLSLSPRALRDIAAIEAHYAQFGLVAADRVLAAIKTAADGVRLNPLIGTEGIRTGTRHKVTGRYPYTIVYRVHRNGKWCVCCISGDSISIRRWAATRRSDVV